MEMGWIQELLKLLFGNLGAIGTLAVAFGGYLAWMLHLEQKEHALTREKNEILNEKRVLVFEAMAKALAEHHSVLLAIKEQLSRRK